MELQKLKNYLVYSPFSNHTHKPHSESEMQELNFSAEAAVACRELLQ